MGLLIALVGALFGGIGLDAVPRFLAEPWVFLPLAGAAFAFSVTRLRTRPELLETKTTEPHRSTRHAGRLAKPPTSAAVRHTSA